MNKYKLSMKAVLRRAQIEEATRRLEEITEVLNLQPNIVDKFREGEVSYSYLTTNEKLGCIAPISSNKSYESIVRKFEKENEDYMIYHVIESIGCTGIILGLLAVNDDEHEWDYERLEIDQDGDSAGFLYGFIVNMCDMKEIEYASIDISRSANGIALIQGDCQVSILDDYYKRKWKEESIM